MRGYPVTGRLLTAAELADHLALSTATILDWFEAGRLPGFKLGRVVRFRETEVLEWVEAHRVGPGAGGEVAPVPFKSPGPARSLAIAPVPVPGGRDAS
jgi:excisionase family DNA binding protein